MEMEVSNIRPRSRAVLFTSLIGGVCLAVWFQFHYFKAQSDNESTLQKAEVTKPLTAKERAAQAMARARAAQEREELQKLIAASQTPRAVVNGGEVQPNGETSTGQPKNTNARSRAPPVYGASWGKETKPALRDFSKWTKDYANANEQQRALMAERGVELAMARRDEMAQLIANDPAAAVAAAVPRRVMRNVPLSVRAMLERRISGVGDLDVYGVTPQRNGKALKPVERTARFGLESFEATVYGRLARVGTQKGISMHGVVLAGGAHSRGRGRGAGRPGGFDGQPHPTGAARGNVGPSQDRGQHDASN